MRLEVVAIGNAQARRQRMVRIVRNESIRPDDKEGPDEGKPGKILPQRVLKGGIVVRKVREKPQRIGDMLQRQVDRTDGTGDLLLQHVRQIGAGPETRLADLPALLREPEGQDDEQRDNHSTDRKGDRALGRKGRKLGGLARKAFLQAEAP
jgi:hypothetical protein